MDDNYHINIMVGLPSKPVAADGDIDVSVVVGRDMDRSLEVGCLLGLPIRLLWTFD